MRPLVLVAICLGATGETRLSGDFAPLVRRLMARDQIPGVVVGVVELHAASASEATAAARIFFMSAPQVGGRECPRMTYRRGF